jgi:hypothetical protein
MPLANDDEQFRPGRNPKEIGEISAPVKREPTEVKSAHQANANEEFQEPPSADLAWCVGILIALALIDWFAVRCL